jgi:hypothetical protein
MVARSRGWIKARDKPSEQTWELTSHGAEGIRDHAVPDQAEIDKQLKRANEQIALTNVYPGRGRQ